MNTFRISIFTLAFMLLTRMHLFAQVQSYSVVYSDSLVADKENPIVYNVLSLTNNSNENLDLRATVNVPEGWRKLSPGEEGAVLRIPAGASETMAINIAKGRNSSAEWQKVQLELTNQVTGERQVRSFHIREKEVFLFKTEKITEDPSFVDNPGVLTTGVYVANEGNSRCVYTVRLKNARMQIETKKLVALSPGQDTTIYFNTKISDAEWKKLSKEVFTITVEGKDKTASIPFEMTHTRNSVKVHNSAYTTIPLRLMAGAMANDTRITYNWGFNTQFNVGNHFFSAVYNSRQFGNNVENNVQKGVLSASYGYKHWLLSVGRMSTVRNFFAVGNGFTLSYQTKTKEFSLTAIKHNKNISFFRNDNISGIAKYPVGKVQMEHFAEANFNKVNSINSYILDNVATFLNTEQLRLIGRGGLSLDNNRNAIDKNILLGYKVGYGFNYNLKRWSLSSNGDYHSPDFAGFRRGNSYHNHALNYKLSTTTFVGLTYSENIMKQNYFRDSVYYTDALSYNNKMMGVAFGHNANVHSVNAGTGIFKFSNQGMYNLKQFYYANLNYGVRFTKRARLSMGTKAVFTGKGEIVRSISNLSFSNYHGGVLAMYVRSVNSSDAVDMSNISDLPVRQTITGGPYVNFRLFRSTFTGSVRYNIAKALDEEQISSGVGADVNYTHPKLQTSIVLSGYAPFNHRNVNGLSYTESKYGTLSVMQPIGIPVIIKRKYYDFKIALYNDENGNGMRDASEGPLDNVLVDINDQSMVTDKNGEVTLKNTKIGQYNVGLYKAKREGLIPVNGAAVDFVVDENTNVNLAFKKGRVISGRVKIVQDLLKGEVSEQFIKIIATDSIGRKYTTLTDEEGNFFLYVASGTYDVSLNKDAFKYGDLKPVRVAFTADIDNNESAFVCFELRQKKREIRFLNQGLGKQEDKKAGDKVGKSETKKAPGEEKGIGMK